jgi:hypothetical protein
MNITGRTDNFYGTQEKREENKGMISWFSHKMAQSSA